MSVLPVRESAAQLRSVSKICMPSMTDGSLDVYRSVPVCRYNIPGLNIHDAIQNPGIAFLVMGNNYPVMLLYHALHWRRGKWYQCIRAESRHRL